MRVLLLHPAEFRDPERAPPLLPPNQAPPLGLAYIASYLRRGGHIVSIVDMCHGQGMSAEELVEAVARFSPDMVGLGLYTVTVPVARRISKLLKGWGEDLPIVVGGAHPSGDPVGTAQDPAFDYVSAGEGEITMLELADALEGRRELASVDGLHYRNEAGEVVSNRPRRWLENLDHLPFPARDLLPPLSSYQMNWFQYREWPASTIYTTRGCPYTCIFCERRKIHGQKFRTHSPAYVVREIEMLKRDFGIKELFFYDDTFTLDRKRVDAICDEILRKKVKISWNISTHVNTVSRPLLKKMRQAGLWQIAYGIETGDPRVMKLIQKGTTIEKVRERIQWTADAGIDVKGLFMIGHPTDTPESINRTIEFARSLPISSANFKITTPFVGTELRDVARDYGDLDEDDFRNYSGDPNEAVFVADGLTPEYLAGVQRKAYFRFFSRPDRVAKMALGVHSLSDLQKYTMGARVFGRLFSQHFFGPPKGETPTFLDFEH